MIYTVFCDHLHHVGRRRGFPISAQQCGRLFCLSHCRPVPIVLPHANQWDALLLLLP